MELSRTFPSLLVGATIVLVQPQAVLAISAAEVAQIAQGITVKIESSDKRSQGSGIIIKKDGDSYYVLTAFHVVARSGQYVLIAPDRKAYQIDYQTVKKGANVDLAILQFTSNNTYKTAKIGNSDKATLGATTYVAGFPVPTAAFRVSTLRFLQGQVTANASIRVDGGYTLVYSNSTLRGMSGGPVFNDLGEVIAVHGRAETVSDSDKENPKATSTGNNLGIPINTFLRLAMVDIGVKAPASVVATALKADKFWVEGNGKVKKGDYRGAIASYTQTIDINPQYAIAYNDRGAAYKYLGDNQRAIYDFNRAIEINPEFALFYNNRGLTYSDLGDKQKAISDFNRAIKINPQYANAYYNRGLTYSDLEYNQKAISDFNRAIQLYPLSALAYNHRGLAFSKLGDKQKAIVNFNRVIEINPQYARAYYNRATAYSDLGDNYKAIADFNRAIQLAPLFASAYNSRGLAHSDLGDKQKALSDFNRAIEINPQYANAYYNRAIAYSDLGANQKAIADFTKAAKLYQQQGKTADYQDALNRIRQLE